MPVREMLGRSQQAVLSYVCRQAQPVTADQVASAIYAETSSWGNHRGDPGAPRAWAARLLRSLENAGLVRRVSDRRPFEYYATTDGW